MKSACPVSFPPWASPVSPGESQGSGSPDTYLAKFSLIISHISQTRMDPPTSTPKCRPLCLSLGYPSPTCRSQRFLEVLLWSLLLSTFTPHLHQAVPSCWVTHLSPTLDLEFLKATNKALVTGVYVPNVQRMVDLPHIFVNWWVKMYLYGKNVYPGVHGLHKSPGENFRPCQVHHNELLSPIQKRFQCLEELSTH